MTERRAVMEELPERLRRRLRQPAEFFRQPHILADHDDGQRRRVFRRRRQTRRVW